MKDLTVKQEMALSELLFKALGLGCWHEEVSTRVGTSHLVRYRPTTITKCTCGEEYWGGDFESHIEYYNPNLFLDGNGFFKVWDAVKDREGFEEEFNSVYIGEIDRIIHMDHIASPHFQLEVLRWLLEKDGKIEELERVLREHKKKGGKSEYN